MDQAAARPKTVLSGTAMAATSSVSRIAARASRSVTARSQTPIPPRKASQSTAAPGTSRKPPRNSRATPMSSRRTQSGSSSARRKARDPARCVAPEPVNEPEPAPGLFAEAGLFTGTASIVSTDCTVRRSPPGGASRPGAG